MDIFRFDYVQMESMDVFLGLSKIKNIFEAILNKKYSCKWIIFNAEN